MIYERLPDYMSGSHDLRAVAGLFERSLRFTSGRRIIRAVLTIYERSRDYMSGSHDLRAVAGYIRAVLTSH
ncbi:hypothetical protein HNO89_004195 [Sporosarcina luteola]|nr:hypothetical protein [Sporosarcina luteola]